MIKKIFFLILCFVFILGCQSTPKVEVNNFEDCVKAGNPVMESYPRQCKHLDKTYTESLEDEMEEPDKLCTDLCGDNECQEIVCMGQGCPCAESKTSCPSDCS